MSTIILKFKYKSDTTIDKIITDIKFCGGVIKNKTKLLSNKLIYLTIEEPQDNSFMRKFRETKSGSLILN